MNRTYQKIALLGLLYLAQGLPYGFFTQALPVVLREHGYSLVEVGLASLLALPWALKFLWAPFCDRPGHRRAVILPAQLLCVLLLIVVGFLADSLQAVLFSVLLINLLSATQDIGTDGLALDLLSTRERGLGNGVQVAGYRVGMIIGGGLLLIVYGAVGWKTTFFVMAALMALSATPLAFHRERPGGTGAAAAKETRRSALVPPLLRKPGVLSLFALVFSYKAGPHFAQGMLRPMLSDAGLSLADIGVLLGGAGFVAGLVGALLGGAIVGPLSPGGRRRALLIFGLLQAVTIAPLALISGSAELNFALFAIVGLEHLSSGMATAALFTWMMDQASEERAASDYTLMASAVVIASGIAAALSGLSATALGYSKHFLLAALISALAAGTALLKRR